MNQIEFLTEALNDLRAIHAEVDTANHPEELSIWGRGFTSEERAALKQAATSVYEDPSAERPAKKQIIKRAEGKSSRAASHCRVAF